MVKVREGENYPHLKVVVPTYPEDKYGEKELG